MTSGKFIAAYLVGCILLVNIFDERVATVFGLIVIIAAFSIYQLNQKAKNQQTEKERQVKEYCRITDELRSKREERYQNYLEECDILGNEPLSKEEWIGSDDQRVESISLVRSGLERGY